MQATKKGRDLRDVIKYNDGGKTRLDAAAKPLVREMREG